MNKSASFHAIKSGLKSFINSSRSVAGSAASGLRTAGHLADDVVREAGLGAGRGMTNVVKGMWDNPYGELYRTIGVGAIGGALNAGADLHSQLYNPGERSLLDRILNKKPQVDTNRLLKKYRQGFGIGAGAFQGGRLAAGAVRGAIKGGRTVLTDDYLKAQPWMRDFIKRVHPEWLKK